MTGHKGDSGQRRERKRGPFRRLRRFVSALSMKEGRKRQGGGKRGAFVRREARDMNPASVLDTTPVLGGGGGD